MPAPRGRYDVVVVGGGHNGLVAAAYLAQAGNSVLVLERLDHLGGAAVSARVFPGVDARLSRYAYLVSLLPASICADLNVTIPLHRRRISSYTPVRRDDGRAGLLVDGGDEERTRRSFRAVTGDPLAYRAFQRFYAMTRQVAQCTFPTLTEPLRSRSEMRRLVKEKVTADERTGKVDAFAALFERPLADIIEHTVTDDTVRGVILTDALIGTFARADETSLRQNRCFFYHIAGNGTGDWDVPVGGMGLVSGALAGAARTAGATLRTGAEVVAIDPGGEVYYRSGDRVHAVGATHILGNVAPGVLARLLGTPSGESPEGCQLKVNMLVTRLPKLKEKGIKPGQAFGGTFHVNEGYAELAAAFAEAAGGRIPSLPPCEIYCHSLADPSILGPELTAAGAQTLTLFGLHMPARLFRGNLAGSRAEALAATLRSLDAVLDEPISECLWQSPDGTPCLEVKTPLDLEEELDLPGGHIFHDDLSWPFTDEAAELGRWGVETDHPRVLLCGAGARRGGGISGIPGHNAAMALLQGPTRGHE